VITAVGSLLDRERARFADSHPRSRELHELERFCPRRPRTGAESAAAGDRDVEEYLHLYLLNRGVLITPFHNMALMCPATTTAQVDRHTEAFDVALKELCA
jgi:glutamate-1-semialdehyde 2,1-aminomutase